MRGKTQLFFRKKGKEEKKKEKRYILGLQKMLQRCFNLLNNGLDFSQEINEIKREMSAQEQEINKGVKLRSREQELEEGEKCTQCFFKKILAKGGGITKLKTGGEEVKDTDGILNEVELFFSELYDEKVVHDDAIRKMLSLLETKINKVCAFLAQNFTVLELTM